MGIVPHDAGDGENLTPDSPQAKEPEPTETTAPSPEVADETRWLIEESCPDTWDEVVKAIANMAELATTDPARLVLEVARKAQGFCRVDNDRLQHAVDQAMFTAAQKHGIRPTRPVPQDEAPDTFTPETRAVLGGWRPTTWGGMNAAINELASAVRDSRTPTEFIGRLLGPVSKRWDDDHAEHRAKSIRQQLDISISASDLNLGPAFIEGAIRKRDAWQAPEGCQDMLAQVRPTFGGEAADVDALKWAARDLLEVFLMLDAVLPVRGVVAILEPAANAIGVSPARLEQNVREAAMGLNSDFDDPVETRMVEAGRMAINIAMGAACFRDEMARRHGARAKPLRVEMVLGAMCGRPEAHGIIHEALRRLAEHAVEEVDRLSVVQTQVQFGVVKFDPQARRGDRRLAAGESSPQVKGTERYADMDDEISRLMGDD